MIDWDKMTLEEHRKWREMERKAKAWDELKMAVKDAHDMTKTAHIMDERDRKFKEGQLTVIRNILRLMEITEKSEQEG